MGDDRPSVYKEGDLWVYRASALGGCVKSLVAGRLGFDPLPTPDFQQAWFDAGTEAEPVAIERMQQDGWEVMDSQMEVELNIGSGLIVRGHIDGMTGGKVLEIKSQSQAMWDKFNESGWESGFFPHYKWQISVYKHALNMDVVLVRYNRDSGEIDYITLYDDFYSLDEIRDRVTNIEAWAETGALPNTCSEAMFPCPFVYLHEDNRIELTNEQEGWAFVYLMAREQEKDLKNSIDESKARLLKLGVGKYKGQDYKVTVFEKGNPPRLDRKAMEDDGIDLSPYMKPGGTSIQVRVTPLEEDDEESALPTSRQPD